MLKKVIKIKSKIYDSSREIGIKRCGDNFIQNNSEVKTIKVKDVLDVIIDHFKNEKINPTPVAINGYWKDKETFSIKILYLENTAKANLDLQFNSNEIEMEVTLKGVFASKTKFKLSGSK